MILNPAAFTYEHLSNLKFKELQKLSAQFRVNKRWAKKQELIENLLAIKPEENSPKNENFDVEEHDENEWRDGGAVFQDLTTAENNIDAIDRKLTFNVDKTDKSDVPLTVDVPPKEAPLFLTTTSEESSLRRDTYDVSSKAIDINLDDLKDSRGTYDVPQKEILILDKDIPDSRATYDVPNKHKQFHVDIQANSSGKLYQEGKHNVKSSVADNVVRNSITCCQKSSMKFGTTGSGAGKKNKHDLAGQSKVKMLTIPYRKVPRRTNQDMNETKCSDTLLKMSQKSVSIKKSRLPNNLDGVKSPNSMRRTLNRKPGKQDLAKLQSKKILLPTKIPIILTTIEKKPLKPDLEKGKEIIEKENLNIRLKRRKSRTADEVLLKKPSCSKVNFMSPPVSNNTCPGLLMPIKRTPMRKTIEDLSARPVTARKMPDFNRIHQKQFEQMDSLHDYLKKKEERTRKLFGTPQEKSGIGKMTTLFTFQSDATVKPDIKYGTSKSRENLSMKMIQKEAVKNKLPPSKLQTDTKNKNRSHINGVRTNKRFELQMKLRNM